MSFTSTIVETVPGTGSRQHVIGTYVNTAGSTGGDVPTYLTNVQGFFIQPWGAVVASDQSVVNETLPLVNTNGTVTIVTPADQSGSWEAWGY